MATYIKTLKEDNGDITYPQTKAGAVLLNNGSDLETELSQYVTAEDIASTSALTPPVQTNMIANGAVTSDKIDWTTTGGMKLLATVPLSSFGTSDSNTYQLDLRTLFCDGNSNRMQYFHHLLLELGFYTQVGDGVQSYIRFGKKTSNNPIECHRKMITLDPNSFTYVDQEYSSIIFNNSNQLREVILVAPMGDNNNTVGNFNVDNINNFSFSNYYGTQSQIPARIHFGSWVRLQYLNGKVPVFFDTLPNSGNMKIWGVKYPD